jgi:hypothetical protein
MDENGEEYHINYKELLVLQKAIQIPHPQGSAIQAQSLHHHRLHQHVQRNSFSFLDGYSTDNMAMLLEYQDPTIPRPDFTCCM